MNVALIKLSSLGDVVHALPVAASLHAARPDARLTWIVEQREAMLLREHPALERVVAIDTRSWRRAGDPRAVAQGLRAIVGATRRLRAARFDVAIDLQGLIKSGLITAATGAPTRVGFVGACCRERLNTVFTNRRVIPPPAARHVIDQYLSLLEPLGVALRLFEFQLPRDPRAEAAIDGSLTASGLKAHDRLVVLNPGAGRADKRWPVGPFRDLARRLADEAAANVFVVWGPGEEGAARMIVDGAPRATLAPPTDLNRLMAVLRRASVVVAGDTGPLHLAAALGAPCVGLYGPTRAERNGPFGAGHRAFQGRDGRIETIEVEAVFRAVCDVLG